MRLTQCSLWYCDDHKLSNPIPFSPNWAPSGLIWAAVKGARHKKSSPKRTIRLTRWAACLHILWHWCKLAWVFQVTILRLTMLQRWRTDKATAVCPVDVLCEASSIVCGTLLLSQSLLHKSVAVAIPLCQGGKLNSIIFVFWEKASRQVQAVKEVQLEIEV